jgi:hypothetical protein
MCCGKVILAQTWPFLNQVFRRRRQPARYHLSPSSSHLKMTSLLSIAALAGMLAVVMAGTYTLSLGDIAQYSASLVRIPNTESR